MVYGVGIEMAKSEMKEALPEPTAAGKTSQALIIAAIGVVYLASLFVLPRGGFWFADDVNKFLIMQSAVRSGFSDYSIPWPGAQLDPKFEYNPMPAPFSVVERDRLYSIYSPVLPTLAAPLYRGLGFRGLYLLTIAASVLMLLGLTKLAAELGFSLRARRWAVILAGLATPVWFYSLVFWEHAIGVCFAVWACALGVRYLKSGALASAVSSGAACAAAIYFRDELYMFAAILLAGFVLFGRKKRFAAGALFGATALATLLPLWFFQWKTLGRPLGFHVFHLTGGLLSSSGLWEHIRTRPHVLYTLFTSSSPGVWLSSVLGMVLIILLVARASRQRKWGESVTSVFLIGTTAYAVLVLLQYAWAASPIVTVFFANSLLAASPVLLLAFMPTAKGGAAEAGRGPNSASPTSEQPLESEDSRLIKWLWFVILGYGILYALAAPSAEGVHWGNRFLLVLYPLLAIPAAARIADLFGNGSSRGSDRGHLARRRVWPRAVAAGCLALSVLAQVYSMDLLAKKKSFSERLNAEVKSRPEQVIVTNVWWVPQELYSTFFDKPAYYAKSPALERELVNRLAASGVKSFLHISPPLGLVMSPNTVRIDDRGLGFFTLQVTSVQLEQKR